jgi:hypothetical protein
VYITTVCTFSSFFKDLNVRNTRSKWACYTSQSCLLSKLRFRAQISQYVSLFMLPPSPSKETLQQNGEPCIILLEGISVQLTVMLYSTFGDGISGVHTYYGGYATTKAFVSCHQSTHRKHPDCIKKIAFACDVL